MSHRPGRAAAGAFAGAALVAAPLLALVVIATGGDTATLRHVASTVLPHALAETALLLAGVAVVAGLAGVGTAWLVSAYRFPGRLVLQAALVLPLAVPPYIAAYTYVEVLDPLGPVQSVFRAVTGYRSRAEYGWPDIRSLPGAILVMGAVLYPYVYLTTRALFSVQSANLLDVARTLGARPSRIFVTVALPLARPAVVLGLSLALLEALNDIGATEYLGVRTLTVSIYTTWINRGSLAGAAQIACVMLLVVVMLLVFEARARGARGYAGSLKRPRPAAPALLPGWQGWAASLACALPLTAGFLIPAAYLLHEAVVRTLRRGIDPDFLRELVASLTFAAVATVLVVALGAWVAVSVRLCGTRLVRAAARVTALGYAVPGTVLAVGLLSPLAAVDNAVADVWRALTGVSPGLVLTGSGAAVVIAYLVRFVGIASGGVETGLSRISMRIDDAARTLGRRPVQLTREIHLPLVRPALLSAALMVFVDAMKELPATLLLRPLNVDTLATGLYAHASRGSFEDGALAALAIVGVGLVPVVALMRLSPGTPPVEAAAVDPAGVARPAG